ncbi:glycoside hydrolase family 3 C-terminal domain-containing protein [Vibrio cionasavignyae]|uniref:glycoside hydrolase family 3 C-terminal domain-containing protein n=1 Tax=Vibrio cionasavignyae TaxID=2910252 RepID=UPI003D0EC2C1
MKNRQSIQKEVNELLTQLTLEEKASLCSGKDFWHLQDIERLGIPSVMVTDGPHGLRKQQGNTDHLGLSASVKSTCFPTAVTLASSWDVDLIATVGEYLATEALKEDVSTLLGPGMNIKRHPLCGRNFEYFSEDPYLTGRLATSFVNGVQKHNVGTSVKHYAVNNQETNRMVIDTLVDERTLREIYLPGFEDVVKNAQPWTVMCAYNQVNGEFCSEHNRLLNDILREEWGFEGLVVTDWGAMNNRVEGIKAGLDLEMPGCAGLNDIRIVEAVKDGSLDEKALDRVVERILALIVKSKRAITSHEQFDIDTHHQMARKAAGESMVLLKNDAKTLPLSSSDTVAVIGQFAKTPRYQGSGSSQVTPTKVYSLCDALNEKLSAEVRFAAGYRESGELDAGLISEAVELARSVDKAIVMVGLPNSYEAEAFDRIHMNLPESHNALIEAVHQVNPNVIVVLSNGSPVTMPWIDKVPAILESYLGGQASGGAICDILYGDVCPSGKLAETFPLTLEDCASNANFPGLPKQVVYKEGLNVGYRHFDSHCVSVLFPFGHGLSYTDFSYHNATVVSQTDEQIVFSVEVTNSGSVAGKEVLQLYIEKLNSQIERSKQELKAFEKVDLQPGESKTVEFTLDRRAFSFFSSASKQWEVEAGEYHIHIGASSRDIRDSVLVTLVSDYIVKPLDASKRQTVMTDQQFEAQLGRTIPAPQTMTPFTENSTLKDIQSTWIGRKVNQKVVENMAGSFGPNKPSEAVLLMVEKAIQGMPLRSLVLLGGGKLKFEQIDFLVKLLNGHYVRALGMFLKRKK